MAYIYKITNRVNGKEYVGQTSFSITHRLAEHFKQARQGNQRPLCRAIRKYGEENFRIELIEETNIPNEREKYWIQELDTYRTGYNATLGGEGSPEIIKDELLSVWGSNGKCSIKELSKITNHDYSYLCKLFKEWGIENPHFEWKTQRKRVAKLDMITGELIEEFDSIANAARSVAVDPYKSHIPKVCDGKRVTAYGYKWQWL